MNDNPLNQVARMKQYVTDYFYRKGMATPDFAISLMSHALVIYPNADVAWKNYTKPLLDTKFIYLREQSIKMKLKVDDYFCNRGQTPTNFVYQTALNSLASFDFDVDHAWTIQIKPLFDSMASIEQFNAMEDLINRLLDDAGM